MSSNRFVSGSGSFSTATQHEVTQSSESDSDIPLSKMADSKALLADARQRVANLEKEERLLKLKKEKEKIDLKSRKVKEELEKAEKALRKEKSDTGHAAQSDSATQEPPKKKPRLDGPRRPQVDETATATNAEQTKEDVTGYDEPEALRIGPCNSCRGSNSECIRSRRTTKTGTVELGRCSTCQNHHVSCVWGVGGYIRFRPRQSIAEPKEPRKRTPSKLKLTVKGPAVVEKIAATKPAGSGSKGKALALDVEVIRKEMIEMHSKTMRAIKGLTERVVALETQKAAGGEGPATEATRQ